MNITSSRRDFIFGTLAILSVKSSCLAKVLSCSKWYKGNIHMHTFWSDGKAFPEEAVEIYKNTGYNFICLSDHNTFQSKGKWLTVDKKNEQHLERFLKSHPDQETRVTQKGIKQIKLSSYKKLKDEYEEEDKFKLFKGVESTICSKIDDKIQHHVHMNYINIGEVLACCKSNRLIKKVNNKTVGSIIAQAADDVEAYSKKNKTRSLLMLNHPIWKWYDIAPKDLMENSKVRFFELCNGGAIFNPHKDLPSDGFDTDRFWDVVNAFRAKRKEKLLLGVGSDDTHYYFDKTLKRVVPFNAWIKVRSPSLSEEDIISAMDEGDFMTCQGIEFDNIAFGKTTKTLTVTVTADHEKERTVRFIVSKKDFNETPVRTLEIRPVESKKDEFIRNVEIFDEKIGMTADVKICKKGETHSFTYQMNDDDLYVRARVEQDGIPRVTWPMHPKNTLVAWTQPYM